MQAAQQLHKMNMVHHLDRALFLSESGIVLDGTVPIVRTILYCSSLLSALFLYNFTLFLYNFT